MAYWCSMSGRTHMRILEFLIGICFGIESIAAPVAGYLSAVGPAPLRFAPPEAASTVSWTPTKPVVSVPQVENVRFEAPELTYNGQLRKEIVSTDSNVTATSPVTAESAGSVVAGVSESATPEVMTPQIFVDFFG